MIDLFLRPLFQFLHSPRTQIIFFVCELTFTQPLTAKRCVALRMNDYLYADAKRAVFIIAWLIADDHASLQPCHVAKPRTYSVWTLVHIQSCSHSMTSPCDKCTGCVEIKGYGFSSCYTGSLRKSQFPPPVSR